jgi:hypothetical protein
MLSALIHPVMGGAYSMHGELALHLKFQSEIFKGRRLRGRPRRRWENNIKIYLRETRRDCRLDSFGSEQGPVMGSSEYGNESSSFMKGWEFPDHLSDYKLLKKDCDPWN